MSNFFDFFSYLYNLNPLVFIQNVILSLSLFAACIAVIANNIQAKKNRTVSLVDSLQYNSSYRDSLRVFNGASSGKQFVRPSTAINAISDGKSEAIGEDHKKVFVASIKVFATLENLAAGVKHGVYHEPTLYDTYGSTIIEIGLGNRDFVELMRKYAESQATATKARNNSAYANLLWLAEKWDKKRHKSEKSR